MSYAPLPHPASLRVTLPPQRFYITDVRVVLTVDGNFAFAGSFQQGFDVSLPVVPGPHVLSTIIELDPFRRTRDYAIDVPPGGLALELAYSRFWGNFKKAPIAR